MRRATRQSTGQSPGRVRPSLRSCLLVPALLVGAGLSGPASAQVARFEAQGAAAGDQLGTGVCGVGDIDGDGYSDFLVGVRFGGVVPLVGRAVLYSGKTGAVLHEYLGATPQEEFGRTVAAAGDLNQDGVPDLLIGAVSDDTVFPDAGSVSAYSGADHSLLYRVDGAAGGVFCGFWVRGGLDVDQDGHDDFVVGSVADDRPGGPTVTGSARVISGLTGADLWAFYGDASGDAFGQGVDLIEDLNGDGHPDILVGGGKPAAGAAGYVRVFSGQSGALLYQLNGAVDESFGTHISRCADLDGDGWPDFLVGASAGVTLATPGSVYVYSGATGSLLQQLVGEVAGDAFGQFAACPGDLDCDGFTELLVGAPCHDTAGVDAGRVYVYSSTSWASPMILDGLARVDGAGDVNWDGFPDFLVSSPTASPVASQEGIARVYLGLPSTCANGPASQDQNGDGIPDSCEVWKDHGKALAGQNGLPRLRGEGLLVVGKPVRLKLDQARHHATTFLVVGASEICAPLFGGTLGPFPDRITFLGFTSSAGELCLAVPALPPVPTGISFYLQAWIIDLSNPAGFSASNELEGMTIH